MEGEGLEYMKKILFMVSSMNIGGVEKSLLSLISTLPLNKYEITILLLEKKGGFLKDVPVWVKVEEVDWYQQIKPIIMQSPQQTVKQFYKDNQFLKVISFVIVYFFSKYFNNRYLYYKYVLKDVKKHPNGYDIAIAYQGPTDIIDYYIGNKVIAKKKISWVHFDVSKHRINGKLYERLYKSYSKIFVVSKEAKDKLIQALPSTETKTKVFKNVISKSHINRLAGEKVEFDENYCGKKIVTVGRLSWEKGQDLAIQVLYKLRQEGYEVRWYCIGEGHQRTEYEQMIKEYGLEEQFKLLGAKTNPYPYLKQCDLYVQPSRHEGYCLTLAEAKCLNKPIVTTDFTGAREQIKDGYNGLIVEFDEQGLYEIIKDFIENPKVFNH